MWIYKITNIQNNKVYIGQTIRPIQDRFHRHINDSFFEIANLKNNCITFIIEDDWRYCNLNEYTKKLINIC